MDEGHEPLRSVWQKPGTRKYRWKTPCKGKEIHRTGKDTLSSVVLVPENTGCDTFRVNTVFVEDDENDFFFA